MKIVFATDHAGFELKEVLIAYVRDELGHEVEDMGAHVFDPEDDYPDYVVHAAKAVSADPEHTRAIILGGSGQGEAMLANRFPHVRATVYYGGTTEIVKLSRTHNNANVLSLGARFVDAAEAKAAVELWCATLFAAEERFVRRIAKAEEYTSST